VRLPCTAALLARCGWCCCFQPCSVWKEAAAADRVIHRAVDSLEIYVASMFGDAPGRSLYGLAMWCAANAQLPGVVVVG
jgi:hypothetical protein